MPLALNCDVLMTNMFNYTQVYSWQFVNLQLHKNFLTLSKFSV